VVSKKEALTEATAQLLWERGYVGTSPAMILSRSNAGQGSMYHHFSGKAELAVAAMTHMADQLRAKVEAALATGDTAIARVHAYLDSERDPLAGCRMGRLVHDHDVVADEHLRAPAASYFSWLRERLVAVLTEGVAKGELNPDADVTTMAALIVATVQGAYVLSRAQHDPVEFDHAISGLKIVLDAVRRRAPAQG
jgi:AcrR family transcriptional regulator